MLKSENSKKNLSTYLLQFVTKVYQNYVSNHCFALGLMVSWSGGGDVQALDWEEAEADLGEVKREQTRSKGDTLFIEIQPSIPKR